MNEFFKALGILVIGLLFVLILFLEAERSNPCSQFGERQELCGSDMRPDIK